MRKQDPLSALFDELASRKFGPKLDGISGDFIELDITDLFGDAAKLPDMDIKSSVEEETQLLHTLLKAVLLSSRDRRRNPTDYWNKENIEELVDISENLLATYPNTRFLGIGNSPSYVIYGMHCVSNELQDNTNVGYVPFSSRYLDRKRSERANVLTYVVDRHSPAYSKARKYRAKYRQILDENFDLNPRSIVDKFRATGLRTAIVDNMQQGSSFASFIHLMYEWADEIGVQKKAFARALKCIALIDLSMPATIQIPEAGLVVPVEQVRISENLRLALNGNMSSNKDRFVPHFSPDQWRRPLEKLMPRTEAEVSRVKGLIEDEVCQKLCPRPVIRVNASGESVYTLNA